MGTDAGFTLNECAYAPEMTRAQALALRTAGALNPNCVVVITDGPVIGTAGNTSATRIELNPVTNSDLGMSAKVHTTFHTAAWQGIYDIDLGAQGSIQLLTDHWNNTAQDADADAPTVHTQVPWHRGSNNFRDNFFDDVDLPGWATAGGALRDNVLQETSVDLTGMTTGFFVRNTVISGFFTTRLTTVFANNNQLNGASVEHLGSGAGSFSFQNNTMLSGTVQVTAPTTSQVTLNSNVFGGTTAGYRVIVDGKTAGVVIVSGNRLFNNGPLTYDLRVAGSVDTVFTSNEVSAGSVNLIATSGNVQINACNMAGHSITVNAGTDVRSLRMTEGTLTVSAPAASTLNNVDLVSSTLTLTGAGGLSAGRLLGTTLTTAGFTMSVFDVVGGTKTLTANQSDRLRNASFTNLI